MSKGRLITPTRAGIGVMSVGAIWKVASDASTASWLAGLAGAAGSINWTTVVTSGGPWILIVAGLGTLLWAQRPAIRRRLRRPTHMTLGDIIRYVSTESQWIIDNQDGSDLWIQRLNSDVRDAFSTGTLKAVARRGVDAPLNPIGALESMPSAEWTKAIFGVLLAFDGLPRIIPVKTEDGLWSDIRVPTRDVRRVWRPLRPWHRRLVPPIARMSDHNRQFEELVEGIGLELDRTGAF